MSKNIQDIFRILLTSDTNISVIALGSLLDRQNQRLPGAAGKPMLRPCGLQICICSYTNIIQRKGFL